MAVLIKVYGPRGLRSICDQRCYNAVTKRCRCCCGGVNHGVGLNKAISNTKRLFNAQIAENCDGVLSEQKIVRPQVQPALFPEVIT